MADEIDEARAHIKVARSRVERALALTRKIHADTAHQRLLFTKDGLDDADDAILETDGKLRLIQAAYDADAVDEDRRERARRRFGGRR
jgi:hypothetical protein